MTMTLDTIEMTRRIRDKLYEQIKDMSPEERLAFYHTQAQKVHRELGLPLPAPSSDTADVLSRASVQRTE